MYFHYSVCVSRPTISFSLLVSFSLPQIIARQLLDAFIEIHSKGVFHKDIKLDNILVETGSDVPRIRIIDFGCASFLSEGPCTIRKGKLPFLEFCSQMASNIFPVSVLYLSIKLCLFVYCRRRCVHPPWMVQVWILWGRTNYSVAARFSAVCVAA